MRPGAADQAPRCARGCSPASIPQRLGCDFLPLPDHPARQVARGPGSRIPRATRNSRPAVVALSIAIKAAVGAGLKQQTEITMAQIGFFTRGEDGPQFGGTIRTLPSTSKPALFPPSLDKRKGPRPQRGRGHRRDRRRMAADLEREMPYHSVKLDDPSFPTPIFANLVEVEDGTRSSGRAEPAAAASQLLAPGIMWSAHPPCGAEILVLSDAAPITPRFAYSGLCGCTA